MTISINVHAQSNWKEENFSGVYDMVETVNNRPAYKVSFCNFFKIFIKVLLLSHFRGTKKLNLEKRFISCLIPLKLVKNGILRTANLSILEMVPPG